MFVHIYPNHLLINRYKIVSSSRKTMKNDSRCYTWKAMKVGRECVGRIPRGVGKITIPRGVGGIPISRCVGGITIPRGIGWGSSS